MIEVIVRREAGYEPALYGMYLSKTSDIGYGLEPKRIMRARKLAPMQGGHNKFLESMILWVEVNAPRYWWQHADTYRLSTKQSASTMYTLLKQPLQQSDFAEPIPESWLVDLNNAIQAGSLDRAKALLPESFLQRRMWCLSYKTLQNIWMQRRTHKLKEWRDFLDQIMPQIDHPEFLREK